MKRSGPSQHYRIEVFRWLGVLIIPPLCQETPVSQTAGVVFFGPACRMHLHKYPKPRPYDRPLYPATCEVSFPR